MFTDTRIENAVRAALERDPRIHRPELIAISVDEIGTVVLRGSVANLPQRLAAARDARQIDGVFDVIVDDLNIHPPVGDVRADDEIRAAAYERLTQDSRIHSTHVHVKVRRGRITLSGYVRHEAERAAAVEDVTRLTGVVGVSDRIEVR